jgi:hypothetical protein
MAVIAGQHHDIEPEPPEFHDRVGRARPERVGNAEHRHGVSIDGDEDRGAAPCGE